MQKQLALIASIPAMFYGASAHAALSTELTTMLSDIKTDGVAAATLVLGAVVAVYVVKFIRKAL